MFSVSNVNFILSINREQLVKIIKHAYGIDEQDAYIYLQKFVHIETNLPTLKDLKKGEIENLKIFLSDLISAFEIPNHLFHLNGVCKIIEISKGRINYNPRSIERFLTLYAISLSSCRDMKASQLYKHMLLLCIFKVHARPFYEDLKITGRLRQSINGLDFGPELKKYLSGNEFFLENEHEPTHNHITIHNIKEAAKVVDIYDIPLDPKIKNMTDKEIIDKATKSI